MNWLIPLLALATLAGCSPASDSEPADAATAEAAASAVPTTLAGVDLTQPVLAMGTEPFWSVEIVDGVATWKDMSDYAGDVTTPRTGQVVSTAAGNGVAYAFTLADGTPVTLTLTPGPCPDAGEQTRALNATLAWGDSTQTACADALSSYPPLEGGA